MGVHHDNFDMSNSRFSRAGVRWPGDRRKDNRGAIGDMSPDRWKLEYFRRIKNLMEQHNTLPSVHRWRHSNRGYGLALVAEVMDGLQSSPWQTYTCSSRRLARGAGKPCRSRCACPGEIGCCWREYIGLIVGVAGKPSRRRYAPRRRQRQQRAEGRHGAMSPAIDAQHLWRYDPGAYAD